MNMRPSSFTEPAPRPAFRTPKRGAKGAFAKASRPDVRMRARYIELPRNLWDSIVLLMFVCCLFVFLHAFCGFGVADEDLHRLNDASSVPRAALSISSPWNRGSSASKGGRGTCARGMTRAMVDWHGDYEHFPSTTSTSISPASIPQDAFPDPTPPLEVKTRGRRPVKSFPSVTTHVKTAVDTPFAFYEVPYDPFRLEFEDSVEKGGVGGLYPIAGPPRTAPQRARTLRFGRCDGCI